MKQFLILLVGLVATSVCYSAPTYTSYFNNTHTYTNATVVGTNFAGRGVFTNGITAGASTFNGPGNVVTITNTAAADAGIVINQFTGATNAAISVNTAGASQFKLYGEAANTLAMRNGTAAQTITVYNTFTDSSNYERGFMSWGGNNFFIGTGRAGTGSARDILLQPAGALIFQSGGANSRWTVNSSGHILAIADNTYDIGASGATRPRNVYVGTKVTTSTLDVTSTTTGAISLGGGSAALGSASAGIISFLDNGSATMFRMNSGGTLQFAGSTGSFPALKRSTTNLVVRLADDSANTGLEANVLISRLNATSAAAPTIASATTIAPTNSIVFISGTDAIETITAPAPISATGGQITLIPTGIFTTTTAGNIALASTAVVSRALIMTYDSGTTKWYPSY